MIFVNGAILRESNWGIEIERIDYGGVNAGGWIYRSPGSLTIMLSPRDRKLIQSPHSFVLKVTEEDDLRLHFFGCRFSTEDPKDLSVDDEYKGFLVEFDDFHEDNPKHYGWCK